jgi:hypothetical protein
MLTYDEKVLLFKRLPNFELSYEKILHKKVCGDMFMIIPSGKKSILWITYWNGNNICIIIHLNNIGEISINDSEVYPLCFTNELAYGTLIYGTFFSINNKKYFTFENILYYKGINTQKYTFNQEINLFSNIFTNKEISQKIYTQKFIIVGMPIILNTYEEALNIKSTLPYLVYGINVYEKNNYIGIIKNEICKNEICKNEIIKNNVYKRELGKGVVWFKIKATIHPDIYELYCTSNDTNTEILYGNAMIPSYKISVMMNTLFRNIKENYNLDLLEESDSEEEFENIDESKFVDLNKTLIMNCNYMSKFKKWVPMCVTNNNVKITTFNHAQYLENKNKYLIL